jgi:polyketide cyclase/dehydrase/lipid transport protein
VERLNMPKLVNSVDIRRSAEDVFDYTSNLKNEMEWNPNLISVEPPSVGPVGVGTRLTAKWRGRPPMTIEYTRFDRPRIFETVGKGKGMDAMFRAEVSTQGDGTHFTVTMDLHPKGLMRLMSPVIQMAMQRQEKRLLGNLRSRLESD